MDDQNKALRVHSFSVKGGSLRIEIPPIEPEELEDVKAFLRIVERQLGRATGIRTRKSMPNRANGAHARMEKLSPEERSEIARNAANARWSNGEDDSPA